VARFLGEANLLPGGRPTMARPERLVVGPEAGGCPLSWDSTVTASTFLGADVRAEVLTDDGLSLIVRTRRAALRPGERLRVGVPADASWVIPEDDP
jgi:hypothetical protein